LYLQGDIVLTQFPFTDLSGSKLRPAVIISNDKLNAAGDYVCIQITSKKFTDDCFFVLRDSNVSIPLKLDSGIRLQKIFTVNSSIVKQKISAVTESTLAEIIEAINSKVIGK